TAGNRGTLRTPGTRGTTGTRGTPGTPGTTGTAGTRGTPDEIPFNNYIPPLQWGCMFEPIATDIYMKRQMTYVHEFGILQHPYLSYFGASPDGISSEGIMLEIKRPHKRKITGEIGSRMMCSALESLLQQFI
ncbi:hypothetical protein DUNSADRAFT_761, partial [Dunaliella salina]